MTVDEIIAKMRKVASEDESTPDGILGQTLNYLADELEKAINEERSRRGGLLIETFENKKPDPVRSKKGIAESDFLSALTALEEKTDLDELSSIADALSSDLAMSGIEFDTENCTGDPDNPFDMPGFKFGHDMLFKGTPVMWFGAGGDWEQPVAFCLYLGEDDNIHAYVPCEGNCYNKETNSAFGNSPEMSALEEMESLGIEYKFDMGKMREDASKALEEK